MFLWSVFLFTLVVSSTMNLSISLMQATPENAGTFHFGHTCLLSPFILVVKILGFIWIRFIKIRCSFCIRLTNHILTSFDDVLHSFLCKPFGCFSDIINCVIVYFEQNVNHVDFMLRLELDPSFLRSRYHC